MTFATIEEAWGVTTLNSSPSLSPRTVPADPTPRPKRDPNAPAEVYEHQSSARERAYVRDFIDRTYTDHGIAGVMALLSRRVLTDVRTVSFVGPQWMSMNQLLGVLLALFVIVVLLDILR